jgi:hypothetical protein
LKKALAGQKVTLPDVLKAQWLSGCLGAPQRLAAIAQSFGDMDAADLLGAIEIGERAGDAKRAVIAACAERESIGRIAQQRQPRGLGRGDFLKQRSVAFGIGAPLRGRGQNEIGAETAGTSIWRSMRSSNGSEMRAW